MKSSILCLKNEFFNSLCGKWSLQCLKHLIIRYGNFFLCITLNAVAYHLRLMRSVLAGHWSQWTVMLWDKCLPITFHDHANPLDSENGASIFYKQTGSYDHLYPNLFSIFWNIMADEDRPLRYLKIFHCVIPDLFRFISYIRLLFYGNHLAWYWATAITISCYKVYSAIRTLSFLIPFSFYYLLVFTSIIIFLKMYRNEHCRHQPHRVGLLCCTVWHWYF